MNLLKQSVNGIGTSVTELTQRVTAVEGVANGAASTANTAVTYANNAINAINAVIGTVYTDVTGIRNKNTTYQAGPNGRHVIVQWNVSGSHTATVKIGSVAYNVSNSGAFTPFITQFWVPANTTYSVNLSTGEKSRIWLETHV